MFIVINDEQPLDYIYILNVFVLFVLHLGPFQTRVG